jgi:hypothetical protein
MFNWLKPKRLGIWKDDKLFDFETGVLLAEVLKNDKNLFYNLHHEMEFSFEYHHGNGKKIFYLSKENAMIAAEKKYKIQFVQS